MKTLNLNNRQYSALAAAIRYFRRRAEDSHLLDELGSEFNSYSDVWTIASNNGQCSLPTLRELEVLDSTLNDASAVQENPPLWAVVVLNGGLLYSLEVSESETESQKVFADTCRAFHLPTVDPADEDMEIYYEKLTAIGDTYCPA